MVLSAKSSRVSTSIVGAPVGIASSSLTLIFSLTTGIVKKNTKYNKIQKQKT